MKKKLLIAALSLVCALSCSVCFSGCLGDIFGWLAETEQAETAGGCNCDKNGNDKEPEQGEEKEPEHGEEKEPEEGGEKEPEQGEDKEPEETGGENGGEGEGESEGESEGGGEDLPTEE